MLLSRFSWNQKKNNDLSENNNYVPNRPSVGDQPTEPNGEYASFVSGGWTSTLRRQWMQILVLSIFDRFADFDPLPGES